MLYSAFTYYSGFKVDSGEYKVIGLANKRTGLRNVE
jgi:predicted NodU family carbamoyl transferase